MLDLQRLHQPGRDHWRHQVASAAERQILVHIGDTTPLLGYEQFAAQPSEGVGHPLVGHRIGPKLAFNHVGAGRLVA